MASAKSNLSQEYRNRVRVFVLIDYLDRQLCRDALFNKENCPSDIVEFYKKLETEQSRICRFKSQRQILCPSSEITDYNDFQLTLFTGIIEVIFGSKFISQVKDVRN